MLTIAIAANSASSFAVNGTLSCIYQDTTRKGTDYPLQFVDDTDLSINAGNIDETNNIYNLGVRSSKSFTAIFEQCNRLNKEQRWLFTGIRVKSNGKYYEGFFNNDYLDIMRNSPEWNQRNNMAQTLIVSQLYTSPDNLVVKNIQKALNNGVVFFIQSGGKTINLSQKVENSADYASLIRQIKAELREQIQPQEISDKNLEIIIGFIAKYSNIQGFAGVFKKAVELSNNIGRNGLDSQNCSAKSLCQSLVYDIKVNSATDVRIGLKVSMASALKVRSTINKETVSFPFGGFYTQTFTLNLAKSGPKQFVINTSKYLFDIFELVSNDQKVQQAVKMAFLMDHKVLMEAPTRKNSDSWQFNLGSRLNVYPKSGILPWGSFKSTRD